MHPCLSSKSQYLQYLDLGWDSMELSCTLRCCLDKVVLTILKALPAIRALRDLLRSLANSITDSWIVAPVDNACKSHLTRVLELGCWSQWNLRLGTYFHQPSQYFLLTFWSKNSFLILYPCLISLVVVWKLNQNLQHRRSTGCLEVNSCSYCCNRRNLLS